MGAIFWVLVFLVAVKLAYSWRFHRAFLVPKYTQANQHTSPGISVIIAARNEKERLMQHLPKWLDQRKEDFEIVVVNDRSWDGSDELLEEMAERFEKLSVSTVVENDAYKFGKKFALTMGIKKAKYNNILITDADCFPADNKVIPELAKHFHKGENLILGYSPLSDATGFLGWIQRVEHFQTAVMYYGFAKAGKAYMGVGRFLAYTRELYDSVKGYKSHYHLPFGDDDLFVQSVSKQAKIGLVDPSACIKTLSQKSWSAWWKQRNRHFTASSHYRRDIKWLLGISHVLLPLFYSLLIAAFFAGTKLEYLAGLLGGYWLISMTFGVLNGRFFNCLWLGLFMPFWEILIFIVHAFIYLATTLNPRENW